MPGPPPRCPKSAESIAASLLSRVLSLHAASGHRERQPIGEFAAQVSSSGKYD